MTRTPVTLSCVCYVLADTEEEKPKKHDETSCSSTFIKNIKFCFQTVSTYFVQSWQNNAGFSHVFSIVHGSFTLSEGGFPLHISIFVFLKHFSAEVFPIWNHGSGIFSKGKKNPTVNRNIDQEGIAYIIDLAVCWQRKPCNKGLIQNT